MIDVDPVQTALIAGGTLVAKDIASATIMDAYQGLKSRIKSKLGGTSQADLILDSLDTKPEVWTEPLKDLLEGSEALSDPSIIQAAQELLEMIGPSQIAIGDQNVQVAGNVGTIVQGDYNPAAVDKGANSRAGVSAILSEIQSNLRIVELPGTLTTNTLVSFDMNIWNLNKGAVGRVGSEIERVIQEAYAEMASANALAEQNLRLSYGSGYLNTQYRDHVRAMERKFQEAVLSLEVWLNQQSG